MGAYELERSETCDATGRLVGCHDILSIRGSWMRTEPQREARMFQRTFGIVAMLLVSFAQREALAGAYTFTTIDVPNASYTYALGINNSGAVVGVSGVLDTSTGGYSFRNSSFLRQPDASFAAVAFPSVTTTFVSGINDLGQVTGSVNAWFGRRAFVDGTGGDLFEGDARGLNNLGVIVGSISGVSPRTEAFVRSSNGVVTRFVAPGAADTFAFGINDAGEIVGYSYTHTEINGVFAWILKGFSRAADGTSFTEIAVPGARYTLAHDISNDRVVVGEYSDVVGNRNGFLLDLDDGRFDTLTVPGSVYTSIRGINDHGEVVGVWNDVEGVSHGFLANPIAVSEPNTLGLLAMALLALRGARTRRRTLADNRC